MVRGTTPGYVLSVSGADLRGSTVYVTIAQGENRKVTLTSGRLSVAYSGNVSTITFSLTQSESLTFRSGRASVQVKFLDSRGNVDATNIGDITVLPVLNEDVI